MNKLFVLIPGIDQEEFAHLQRMTEELDDRELEMFASIYNGKRRKAEVILIATIIGLLGFAGIQRFMVNQIGMGILFFFTGGLCLIGTIVDLVNHRNLALEYNKQVSYESLQLTKVMSS